MIHGFLIWIGVTNASGHAYLWWSGIGSDISEFALAGVLWRRFNCHTRGCPRLGLHRVEGTAWTVCRKHHPQLAGKPDAEQVKQDAREACS